MQKPGLEQAVMIWGAGATMIHIARNMSFTFVKNNKKEKVADFSGNLDMVSGWTVKVIMALILVSNVYHILFAGDGQVINYFGSAVSLVYFFFFGGFFTAKEKHADMAANAAAVSK